MLFLFLMRIISVGIALKVVTPICEVRNLQLYTTTILSFMTSFHLLSMSTSTLPMINFKCSVIQNFCTDYGLLSMVSFLCVSLYFPRTQQLAIYTTHTFFILFIVIMKPLLNLYNKSTSFCNCSGNLNIRMPVIVFDCVNGKLWIILCYVNDFLFSVYYLQLLMVGFRAMTDHIGRAHTLSDVNCIP